MEVIREVKYALFRDIYPFGKYKSEYLGAFPTKLDAFKEMDRLKRKDPFGLPYVKLFFKEVPKTATFQFTVFED